MTQQPDSALADIVPVDELRSRAEAIWDWIQSPMSMSQALDAMAEMGRLDELEGMLDAATSPADPPPGPGAGLLHGLGTLPPHPLCLP